jgi:hypothetical protein
MLVLVKKISRKIQSAFQKPELVAGHDVPGYRSKFGGLWTDRDNSDGLLARRSYVTHYCPTDVEPHYFNTHYDI